VKLEIRIQNSETRNQKLENINQKTTMPRLRSSRAMAKASRMTGIYSRSAFLPTAIGERYWRTRLARVQPEPVGS
jgi:hypothetical protein